MGLQSSMENICNTTYFYKLFKLHGYIAYLRGFIIHEFSEFQAGYVSHREMLFNMNSYPPLYNSTVPCQVTVSTVFTKFTMT